MVSKPFGVRTRRVTVRGGWPSPGKALMAGRAYFTGFLAGMNAPKQVVRKPTVRYWDARRGGWFWK